MASGLTTICNLDDENYTLPLRRWTYFSECPLVSANPENIQFVLEKLIRNPTLRRKLGKYSRDYVLKYHDQDAAFFLFKNTIDYIYGNKNSLIDLFHPLKGSFKNDLPKINPPLRNNKLVD